MLERPAGADRSLQVERVRVALLPRASCARHARVVEGKPVLQALAYGGNVELDDGTEGVQVRLVDVSDSGAPVLLPVDVRDPKPSHCIHPPQTPQCCRQ